MPGSGQPVAFTGIQIDELAEGRLVGHRDEVDLLGLLRQYGVAPHSGPAPAVPVSSDGHTGAQLRGSGRRAGQPGRLARIAAHVAEEAALRRGRR